MALLWALSWLAAAQALEVGDLFGNHSGQVSFWTDPCRQHGSCRLCMAAGCAWQQQAQHCTSAKSLLAEAAGAPQEMCLPEEKVTNFSVDEAHRMARYSYAAYYDQPAGYLSKNAEVVKTFFYTIGAWDRAFGFLAVDRAEKLITLAFRGSETLTQVFVEVLRHTLVPFRGDKQVLVNQFFVHAAEDLLPEITPVLQMQMKSCKSCQLRVTGHSLGAAMAMLVAYNISFWSPEPPVLYTFGQPRTCNFAFAQMAEQRLVLYRVVNGADPVPHLPLCTRQSWLSTSSPCKNVTNGYYHAGTEIWFPSGDYEGNVMCHYRECVRPPRSEDMSCSDGLTWPRSAVVMDHHRYWDVLPRGFCNHQEVFELVV